MSTTKIEWYVNDKCIDFQNDLPFKSDSALHNMCNLKPELLIEQPIRCFHEMQFLEHEVDTHFLC